MQTIYLVQVGNHVSQLGYKTLEEAQEFVKSRLDDPSKVSDSKPYYKVLGQDLQMYTIIDVKVER